MHSCDLLIVGGGIMGLWAALKAGDAGLSVLLVDAGRLGKGASNGHLGALMAHKPDGWNAKKQFQFDALLSLEGELRALEMRTGIESGYRRVGRLMPMSKQRHLDAALRLEAEARKNWTSTGRSFEWRVRDVPPVAGWPETEGFACGFVLDTFAARAAPRALTGILISALKQLSTVRILEETEFLRLDAAAGRAYFRNGEDVAFGNCFIAAGHRSFGILSEFGPLAPKQLGKAVKGQSALLAGKIDPALPLIFLNGLYIIPHEDGHVAIGSTSEDVFDEPYSTDGLLDQLIERARALVPALGDAPVVERWAGLRPKAVGRDPMVGPHPEFPNIHALTGGFKISFGIGHRLADAVLRPILGADAVSIPDSFRFSRHLSLLVE